MKLNKKLVALLLLVVMVFSLAACGSNSIVGKWKVDMDSYLKALAPSEQEYENAMAEVKYANIEVILEFTSDGKVIRTSSYMGQSDTQETTTYKVDGDKLTMDGSTSTFKINGNKLTITENGMSLTFTRK